MEIIIGIGTVVGIMIFGFGVGMLTGLPKYSNLLSSLWIIFILILIATLILYVLQIIHGAVIPQVWLGFLILSLIWLVFARFGRFITKERNYAKTQQRIDTLSEKQDSEQEKEEV